MKSSIGHIGSKHTDHNVIQQKVNLNSLHQIGKKVAVDNKANSYHYVDSHSHIEHRIIWWSAYVVDLKIGGANCSTS